MTIQSAAILGRGALGVMYGSFLSPQLPSEQTYFLAEPHRVERYRQERITVNGTPANLCFKSPKELNKAPDLLIVALKAPVLRQALRLVKDAVDQNTIVVSVMNGISSEDIIAEELGLKKIGALCGAEDGRVVSEQHTDVPHVWRTCDRPQPAKSITNRSSAGYG